MSLTARMRRLAAHVPLWMLVAVLLGGYIGPPPSTAADARISELTDGTPAVAGDYVPVSRTAGVATRKVTAQSIANLGSVVFNVKLPPYNAVGNGTADDTVAVQAALTAGAAATVYFPPGTYKISAYLDVPAGTTVIGAGRGSKILAAATAFAVNSLPAPDGAGASAIFYAGAANTVFRDLYVAGAYAGTGASGTVFGIYLGTNSTNCTVEGVWLEDHSWSGLLVHGSGHLIRGNYTKHNAIDGIEIYDASATRVIGNYLTGDGAASANGVAGIEVTAVTASTGILIHGNIIKDSAASGIVTSPAAGITLKDLTITSNQVLSPALKGITVAVSGATQTDVLIADNIVDTPLGSGGSGHGIFVYDVTRFTIRGNSVRGATVGSGPSGIKIAGASTRGVVSSNILTGNWVGLEIADTANNIAVLTNHIYTNSGADTSITTSGAGIGDVPTFGRFYLQYTNTATVGAVTINKPKMRVNIATAGTSVVVTNSLVTAASTVLCQASTNDTTAQVKNVVPAAGSFTLTTVAVTAQTSFDCVLFNAD